jgi:hypothetical protein
MEFLWLPMVSNSLGLQIQMLSLDLSGELEASVAVLPLAPN